MKSSILLDKVKLYAVVIWIALSIGVLLYGIRGFSSTEAPITQVTDSVLIDITHFEDLGDADPEPAAESDTSEKADGDTKSKVEQNTGSAPEPEAALHEENPSAESSDAVPKADGPVEDADHDIPLHRADVKDSEAFEAGSADDMAEERPLKTESDSGAYSDSGKIAELKSSSVKESNSTVLLSAEQPMQGNEHENRLYEVEYGPEAEKFTIRLKADPEVHAYSYFFLDSPARLAVDIKGEDWRCRVKRMQGFDEGFISKVIIGEHSNFIRFVIHYREIDAKPDSEPGFTISEDGFLIEVMNIS